MGLWCQVSILGWGAGFLEGQGEQSGSSQARGPSPSLPWIPEQVGRLTAYHPLEQARGDTGTSWDWGLVGGGACGLLSCGNIKGLGSSHPPFQLLTRSFSVSAPMFRCVSGAGRSKGLRKVVSGQAEGTTGGWCGALTCRLLLGLKAGDTQHRVCTLPAGHACGLPVASRNTTSHLRLQRPRKPSLCAPLLQAYPGSQTQCSGPITCAFLGAVGCLVPLP